MNVHLRHIVFYTAIAILLSCGERHEPESYQDEQITVIENRFEAGVVVNNIQLAGDKNQSFALYLPSYYTTEKSWPVVYLLDAHARGVKPIQLYSELAEKYGYVLIGSNFSKNGLAWESTLNHINALLEENQKQINIDDKRIYMIGFSGGARVAASMGFYNKNIAGVIGCAAGFPQMNEHITHQFNYLAMVGNSDFNYLEMIQLSERLQQQSFPHQFLTFEGKHDWPPASVMQEAFHWMDLMAMKDGLISSNDSIVYEYYGYARLKGDSLMKEGDLLSRHRHYTNIIESFTDLRDVSEEVSMLDALSNSKQYQKTRQQFALILQQEIKIRNGYAQSFAVQSVNWWDSEVGKIYDIIAKEANYYKRTSYKRVLAYLSLVSYLQSDAALKQGKLQEARKFIDILAIVDPENTDQPYLMALWHAKRGEYNEALSSLQDAIEIGFDDFEKLQSESSFNTLHKSEGYLRLFELDLEI